MSGLPLPAGLHVTVAPETMPAAVNIEEPQLFTTVTVGVGRGVVVRLSVNVAAALHPSTPAAVTV